MMQPAGAAWCDQFPGSASLSDLFDPFRTGVTAFIAALRTAGASVVINATYRPPERAYLMHYACLVAGYTDDDQVFHQMASSAVPCMVGCDIDWTCAGNFGAAKSAAAAMVRGYDIKYPAALESEHTKRNAVDMTIVWQGSIMVSTKSGRMLPAASLSDLAPIGATYGVMKLASDIPHWSGNGR